MFHCSHPIGPIVLLDNATISNLLYLQIKIASFQKQRLESLKFGTIMCALRI